MLGDVEVIHTVTVTIVQCTYENGKLSSTIEPLLFNKGSLLQLSYIFNWNWCFIRINHIFSITLYVRTRIQVVHIFLSFLYYYQYILSDQLKARKFISHLEVFFYCSFRWADVKMWLWLSRIAGSVHYECVLKYNITRSA